MKKIAFLIALLFTGLFTLNAQTGQLNLGKSGLAIDGYDPVAYLSTGKAVEGKSAISLAHNGATYRFSSVQNRDLFKASPGKYLPQYGGWCAYAMGATGEKVSVDPETFKIIDGKLYLFYNSFFNNTLKDWNKNERTLKTSADKNWQKFTL
ncbi:MAG: YHS domain protein [Chitinophagaceae bacterium]|nr:MAG: YHS domain protein [Chitinophagaceae bacterium]